MRRPLSVSPVGLHNHRRDAYRTDEEQAYDKGQRLFVILLLHLLLSAASPAPTHPQAQARPAAGGVRKRWVSARHLHHSGPFSHNYCSIISAPKQELALSVYCLGSVFCWLLPLHSSSPSVGGITYSALPDYDV